MINSFIAKRQADGVSGRTVNLAVDVLRNVLKLEAHLKDMLTRRAPDSQWMFPSPQRGEEDRAAKNLRVTLTMAREEAGLGRIGFHDCRHFFISMCVMSGIDYMTIARWWGIRTVEY